MSIKMLLLVITVYVVNRLAWSFSIDLGVTCSMISYVVLMIKATSDEI